MAPCKPTASRLPASINEYNVRKVGDNQLDNYKIDHNYNFSSTKLYIDKKSRTTHGSITVVTCLSFYEQLFMSENILRICIMSV